MNSNLKSFKPWMVLLVLGLLLGTTMLVYAESNAPFGIQVVRQEGVLLADGVPVGTIEYWNTRDNFIV